MTRGTLEKSGESGNDAPRHLPRQSCPEGLRHKLEELCARYQCGVEMIAPSVLRCNVVIVGKFFHKGSLVSEAWKNEHWKKSWTSKQTLQKGY